MTKFDDTLQRRTQVRQNLINTRNELLEKLTLRSRRELEVAAERERLNSDISALERKELRLVSELVEATNATHALMIADTEGVVGASKQRVLDAAAKQAAAERPLITPAELGAWAEGPPPPREVAEAAPPPPAVREDAPADGDAAAASPA